MSLEAARKGNEYLRVTLIQSGLAAIRKIGSALLDFQGSPMAQRSIAPCAVHVDKIDTLSRIFQAELLIILNCPLTRYHARNDSRIQPGRSIGYFSVGESR
jgi:hypothetical protein